MAGKKILFVASWAILLFLFGVIAALSTASLMTAYGERPDNLVQNFKLDDIKNAAEQVGASGDEVVAAFRGRRATAATWALAFALLAITVVLGPYRRGERWAWWALLITVGLSQLLSLARVLALHSSFGTGAPATILAFTLLGLLAGAPRMFSKADVAG
ncbi:MAG TPA: hypothetical protein VNN73_04830 [Blastocatellia bacterium]|nr:hypothetical protein [Blastocatellia bacterium]